MPGSVSRALAIACFVLAVIPVCAQIDSGNITGRVSDTTGAVIAGAQVTVTQTAMNFESVTQTNEEGIYRVQSLRPGPYRVTIVAAGFKRMVRENLELRMNDTMAVNAVLEVGAVTESVEVSAAAPLLETETSASGQVLDGEYYYRLPVFQRNVKVALFFTPGLTYAGLQWTGYLGGMHINGLRSETIGFFEDGQLGTFGTGGLATDSILNAVEEVKVITTTLPAEYGHSAGGILTAVKKSGTNQLHGLASEYGRVRSMMHRKFFDKFRMSQVQPGWDKPPGAWFQMPDANISGPVYIPKLYDGRNKTFFFFAVQRLMQKQTNQAVSTVPNQAMYDGDFTFGGIGQQIFDPRTTRQDAGGAWLRDAFPGNIIPKSQYSQVARNILAMNPYLAPNVPGTMNTTGPSSNVMTGPPNLTFFEYASLRLDQQFTPNLKAYGSWTYNSRFQRVPPWTIANPLFDNTLNKTMQYTNTASAGVVWVASPTLISDVRAGYHRYENVRTSIAYMQDYAGKLGIPNLPKDTMPQGVGPSGLTESINVSDPSLTLQESLSLKDDTTKVRGSHTFKWGYELLRYRGNSYSVGNPSGSFAYTSTSGLRTNGTELPNTGNNFAAFLVGAVSSVSYNRRLNSSLPRVWQHSFYFQDDWKVRPSLTLNIGMRYNLESPPVQKYGLISIFDRNAPDDSIYTGYTCPAGGCKGAWTRPNGASAYNWDKNRWDPRFGLAWHPLQKIVVRGGFALMHVDMRDAFLYTDELMTETTTQAQPSGEYRPLFMIAGGPPPIVYPARRADGSVPYRGPQGGRAANIADPNIQAPYAMSWNFGVQLELSKDYLLETQYKGSSQVRNTGSYDLNTRPWGIIPNPNGTGMMDLNLPENATFRNTWLGSTASSRPWPQLGNVNYNGNNGHASHHEGTVKIEKRYSKGLDFVAFYTYAKSLEGNSGNPYLDWHLFKARTSFDQTHNFSGTMSYEIPLGKGRKFMNRGGWLNTVIGGFDFVWVYNITSGQPIGMSIAGATTQNYPSWMGTYGDVMLLRRPQLRDNWQDIGGDRYTQDNQNSMIDCGTFQVGVGNGCFTYIPSFSRGNNGQNVWERQRIIAASMSAAKEVPIKERLKFQFRFDFQNPFHWFNWTGPSTALNISNAANAKRFGTMPVTNSEATTAAFGGQPIINLTLALKW